MATVDSTALLDGGRPKSTDGDISDAGARNHDYQ
jgi:hypothetical protein